jgi:hypothetical protein
MVGGYRRHQYGGLGVAEAVRLHQLERENARLKKLLAERNLALEVLKELLANKWYPRGVGGASHLAAPARCFQAHAQCWGMHRNGRSGMPSCRPR